MSEEGSVSRGSEFGPEEQVWPDAKQDRRVRILQKHATYAAMVETMDTAVGRVIDKLKQLDLYDNTVICYHGRQWRPISVGRLATSTCAARRQGLWCTRHSRTI